MMTTIAPVSLNIETQCRCGLTSVFSGEVYMLRLLVDYECRIEILHHDVLKKKQLWEICKEELKGKAANFCFSPIDNFYNDWRSFELYFWGPVTYLTAQSIPHPLDQSAYPT